MSAAASQDGLPRSVFSVAPDAQGVKRGGPPARPRAHPYSTSLTALVWNTSYSSPSIVSGAS